MAVGALLLVHSGWSMMLFNEHNTAQSETDKQSVPVDISIECILGLVIAIWSTVQMSNPFRQRLAAPEHAKR